MPRLAFHRAAGLGLALLAPVSTGCYHSIVNSGLPVSTEVHREPFKAAFIAGLVPAVVDASSYCAGRRWARVETQYSFLNWVVGTVTFGIFTPMDIRVYCAAPGASADVPAGPVLRVGAAASEDQRGEALGWAAKFATESGGAVYVAF